MESNQYYWIFDRTIFDQIRLPEFSLLEGVLIVLGLGALAAYLALIVVLDRFNRRRAKEAKQLAWLERWFENAGLSPGQRDDLDWLAGGSNPKVRYKLLGDPIRFEKRIHEEVTASHGPGLEFTGMVREKLRYLSDNLRVPVVSTRQLQPGDSIRLSLWRSGLPLHYYGKVVESNLWNFSIGMRGEAIKAALAEGGKVDLYFLRGHGLEYGFSCLPLQGENQTEKLVLKHELSQDAQSPRNARLPIILEVPFRERIYQQDQVAELDPDSPSSTRQNGLLLDLSEGGFSIAHQKEITVGHYLEFILPLKRGRNKPLLTGRVLECRAFSGHQWLSRCELKGLKNSQRNMLHQVVRMEQQNRLKALAQVSRRSDKPAGARQA